MKIHENIIQHSPEWYAIRGDKITASEIGPFVIGTDKKSQKARLTLICKKIAALAGEIEECFPTNDMKRGTALEPIARAEYARMMGVEVKEAGFISHDSLPLGASPDGLIYRSTTTLEHGAEIKGLAPHNHVRYLLEGGLPDEFKFQVHMSMAIAEVDRWDFFAFCPRVTEWIKTRDAWTVAAWEPGNIPPLHVVVRRERFTDELMAGLQDLCGLYADTKARMAQLWKERKQAA